MGAMSDLVRSMAPRSLQVLSVAVPYLCGPLTVRQGSLPDFFVCLAFAQMAGTMPVGPYEDHIYLRTNESLRRNWIEIRAVGIGLCSAAGTFLFLNIVAAPKVLALPFSLLAASLPSLRIILTRLQVADPKRATSSSVRELALKAVFLLLAVTILPKSLVESGIAIGWALLISNIVFLASNLVTRGDFIRSRAILPPFEIDSERTHRFRTLHIIALASTLISGLLFFAFEREASGIKTSVRGQNLAAYIILLPRISVVLLFILRPLILGHVDGPRTAKRRRIVDIGVFGILLVTCASLDYGSVTFFVALSAVFFQLQLQVAHMIRENALPRALGAVGVPALLMLASIEISEGPSTLLAFAVSGLTGAAISLARPIRGTSTGHLDD